MRIQYFPIQPRKGERAAGDPRRSPADRQLTGIVARLKRKAVALLFLDHNDSRIEPRQFFRFDLQVFARSNDQRPFDHGGLFNLDGRHGEIQRRVLDRPVLKFLPREERERSGRTRLQRFRQRNTVVVPAGLARAGFPVA